MTDEVRQTSDSGGIVNIRVGDYVWCQDIEEYGFVEKVKHSLHPAYDDVVRVRMESDGAYRSYSAHTLVCANTDTSPTEGGTSA